MTQEEINNYIAADARRGIPFATSLANMRINGAVIPMTMEGTYRTVYDSAKSTTAVVSEVDPQSSVVDVNGNKKSPYAREFDGLKYGENRITGGYDLDTSAAWFGSKDNVGILSGVGSAVGTAATIGKTMLAYDQFEQSKEDNAKKFALMQESNLMKRTQMHNRVAEARRRTAGGLNNSNSQTATLSYVNRNPYLDAQYTRIG